MLLTAIMLVIVLLIVRSVVLRRRRQDPTWRMERDIERWKRLRSIR